MALGDPEYSIGYFVQLGIHFGARRSAGWWKTAKQQKTNGQKSDPSHCNDQRARCTARATVAKASNTSTNSSHDNKTIRR